MAKRSVEKQVQKEIKKHISPTMMVIAALFLAIGCAVGFFTYKMLNPNLDETTIKLNGEEFVTINLGEEYQEEGYIFIIGGYDYSSDVEVEGRVDVNTTGTYYITYTLLHDDQKITLMRVVNVVGGGQNGN